MYTLNPYLSICRCCFPLFSSQERLHFFCSLQKTHKPFNLNILLMESLIWGKIKQKNHCVLKQSIKLCPNVVNLKKVFQITGL